MITIILSGLVAMASCQSVDSARITAKDFARAIPEFSVLPEGVSLGFSPLPGTEWPMRRLERSDIVKAMKDALGQDGFQLEEFSLFPAPVGQIIFSVTGLNRQPKGTSFWRGYVQYGGDKRFNIWAKVRLNGDVGAGERMDVVSGGVVNVLVRCGAAELKLDGQAISSGSKGQVVTVRNPRSGRTFAAEVTGKDSVLVEVGESRE